MSIAFLSSGNGLADNGWQTIPCPRGQHEECTRNWIGDRTCRCVVTRPASGGWDWGGPVVPGNVVGPIGSGIGPGPDSEIGLPWYLDPFGITSAGGDGGSGSGSLRIQGGIGTGRSTILDPLGIFPDAPGAQQGGVSPTLIIAGIAVVVGGVILYKVLVA